MLKNKTVLWIDVACDKLDIYNNKSQEYETIENSTKNVNDYLLNFNLNEIRIIYESTWCYSSILAQLCNNMWVEHHQVHPKSFRHAVIAMWSKNKNDKCDAKDLAEIWSILLDRKWHLVNPSNNTIEELQSIYSHILSLKKTLQSFKSMKHQLEHNIFKSKDSLKFCNKQIKTIEKQIKQTEVELINRLEQLWYKEHLENLQTIPHVWIESSLCLLLFFIDLKCKWFTKQDVWKVKAMAWLYPKEYKSWSSLNKTKISKDWRVIVRRILYMWVTSMFRYLEPGNKAYNEELANTNLGKFFKRMVDKFWSANAKTWLRVIVAVMKKILLISWWIFRNNTPYNWL